MPPTAHSKAAKGRDGSPYGPSWYDVYIIMQDLMLDFPDEGITVRLHSNKSVNNKAGLRVDVLNGVGTVLGACRFLDNGPESATTAAAAFWRACTKAYHQLEAAKERPFDVNGYLDITEGDSPPSSSPDPIGD